jgi:hypothetical protein
MLRAWAVLAGPHRGLGNWVRGKRSDHNPAKPSAAPFISERPVDLAAAPMRTRRKWVLTKSRTVTADAGFRRFVAACGAHLEDLRERRRLGGARAPRAAPGDGRPALQAALIVPGNMSAGSESVLATVATSIQLHSQRRTSMTPTNCFVMWRYDSTR